MANLTLIQAVTDGLKTAMRDDPTVCVFGEDVGKKGGVFLATEGVQDEFGVSRCFDAPLSEDGIIGAAIGMAMNGIRPVAEIQFQDFIFPAFDQIVSEAAKMRWRSGGEYSCPMVIRTPVGGGIRGGLYHSQSPESLFIHTAGLKVLCPSNPYDVKGLLLASIRDDDPVLFLEPKRVYRAVKMDVPEGDYEVEIGKAKVVREGNDVTIVSWGAMVYEALAAAEQVAADGVDCEVIDLRSLRPLDEDIVVNSVAKTHRAVVAYEGWPYGGVGAEVVDRIQRLAFDELDAPVLRVTTRDVPMPYNAALEQYVIPQADRIVAAVKDASYARS